MKLLPSLLLAALIAPSMLFVPSMASADNIGGCGWGSKLFSGQRGIAPQVLAVTTNGTSGNQTFGISSGTSGCTQDGAVNSNWKTAAYVGENMNKLALDVSRGEGESLSSLASLAGVSQEDKAHFNSTLKSNFAQIFPSADVTSEKVLSNMKSVLASDATLARYSANI